MKNLNDLIWDALRSGKNFNSTTGQVGVPKGEAPSEDDLKSRIADASSVGEKYLSDFRILSTVRSLVVDEVNEAMQNQGLDQTTQEEKEQAKWLVAFQAKFIALPTSERSKLMSDIDKLV